jgi:hypothetical protein
MVVKFGTNLKFLTPYLLSHISLLLLTTYFTRFVTMKLLPTVTPTFYSLLTLLLTTLLELWIRVVCKWKEGEKK